MNSINIIGRLTHDPELRHIQADKSVVNFSIAVKNFKKDSESYFFNVVAWGQTAEFVSQYLSKGMRVGISGSLQSRKWEDDNGKKHISVEINAYSVEFADSKKEEQNGVSQRAVKTKESNVTVLDDEDDDEDDDGDLPF